MVQNLTVFVVSSLVFVLTPGLDTLFVVNKSITESRKAGLVASAGISFGVTFHTILAALGLSIILAKSALAFSVIKFVGAAYLVYLGIKAVRQKGNVFDQLGEQNLSKMKLSKVFWLAALTNVLNPKVALFFLAFFPQFVSSSSESAPQAFMLLGAIYAAMSMAWLMILSVLVSAFTGKIKSSSKAQAIVQKASGMAFVFLGIKIAITDQ